MPGGPPISIEWLKADGWKASSRRSAKPTIQQAIANASQGMQYLDIQSDIPKTARIRRTVRGFPDHGSAFNSRLFELFVACDSVKRHKVGRLLSPLSQVAVHELVHTVHFEYFERHDLAAKTVGEGLAYCGAQQFAEAFMQPEDHYPALQVAQDIEPAEIAAQMPQFIKDVSESGPGVMSDETYDWWFLQGVYGRPDYLLGRAEVIGMHVISNLCKQGATIPELLAMSPEDILGIK